MALVLVSESPLASELVSDLLSERVKARLLVSDSQWVPAKAYPCKTRDSHHRPFCIRLCWHLEPVCIHCAPSCRSSRIRFAAFPGRHSLVTKQTRWRTLIKSKGQRNLSACSLHTLPDRRNCHERQIPIYSNQTSRGLFTSLTLRVIKHPCYTLENSPWGVASKYQWNAKKLH